MAVIQRGTSRRLAPAGGKGGPPVSHKRYPLSGSLGRSKSADRGSMQRAVIGSDDFGDWEGNPIKVLSNKNHQRQLANVLQTVATNSLDGASENLNFKIGKIAGAAFGVYTIYNGYSQWKDGKVSGLRFGVNATGAIIGFWNPLAGAATGFIDMSIGDEIDMFSIKTFGNYRKP